MIIGWILAFFSVGGVFGSLLAIVLGFRFGRRWLIFGGCVLMVIGAALQAATFSLTQLLLGRFISGLGIGLLSSSVPVLLAEISKENMRGKIIAMLFVLGVVSANSLYDDSSLTIQSWALLWLSGWTMASSQISPIPNSSGAFLWRFRVPSAWSQW